MDQRIQELAKKYVSQNWILDGVNSEAKEQNIRLINALKYTGGIIEEFYQNQVFGIFLRGSRIIGYHTPESDADIIIVAPNGAKKIRKNIEDIIEHSQKKFKIREIDINNVSQMIDKEIILKDFLEHCEKVPLINNSLYGCEMYTNPNLMIARLIGLEIANKAEHYPWYKVIWEHQEMYLGKRDHTYEKISERFDVPIKEVERTINNDVWKQRFEKFNF